MNKFILLLSLFLVGCASPPKVVENVIIKKQYEPVLLPVSLLAECKSHRPLQPDEYLSLTQDEKELYLTKYSIDLLGDLKRCDNQIEGIRKYMNGYNQNIIQLNKHEALGVK